jgi:predicted acylesterase/phospholipase RssA
MQLITLSPAGIHGFYVAGIVTFIKERYNVENCIFSGASAGAYNALLMTYRGNPKNILEKIEPLLSHTTSLNLKNIQQVLRTLLLDNFQTEDFDLDKLYIGVSKTWMLQKHVFHKIQTLREALDCCIASSHIPYITGGLINRCLIDNKASVCFDGGFLSNPYIDSHPYLDSIQPILHFTPSLWKPTSCITMFTKKEKHEIMKMLQEGYNDSEKHKTSLDALFSP